MDDDKVRIGKAPRVDRPSAPLPPAPKRGINATPNNELVLLSQQLTIAQENIRSLETQLRASEQGRREDNERLLRELMDAKIENAKLTERLRQQNEKSGE